jgi:hypothetical protein
MNTDYFEIRVNDRSGNQKAFYSSSAPGHCVLGGEFTLDRIGGCSKLSLTLARAQMDGEIDHGYLIEAWARPSGGALTKYYTGRITRVPAPGTTTLKVRYDATGLWYQVERATISKFYEGTYIDDIVMSILDDIDDDSDLSSSTSEILLSSPYSLGDLEAESMSAAQAIELLASVQGDVQYGVDQNGKLYFKDVSTDEQAAFWVGKDMTQFEPIEDSIAVVNRLYMQSRELVGGGHLTLVRDQTTGDHSISNLGLADKVAQIPHLSDPGDVWRWAEKTLADSGIKTKCEAKPAGFSEFIFPRGNVRITDVDGNEYELPIQSVTYHIHPTKGFIGEMEIGDEPYPTPEGMFKKMLRDVATAKSNAISLTKIAHTRAEEWQQKSIIDAQELGLLNHFTDDFTDLKSVDEEFAGTVHTNLNTEQHFVSGPLPDSDFEYAQYWSHAIPSGQSVDSVRCHFDFDMYGRLKFDFDSDLDDNFTFEQTSGSRQAWHIREDDHLLVYDSGTGADYADGRLWFTGPTGFSWDASGFTFRIGCKNWGTFATGTYVYIYWDYADANNWNAIRIHNGPTYNSFWIMNRTGGGTPSVLTGPLNDLVDADNELEIRARPSGSVSQLAVYRGGTLQGTLQTSSAPLAGGNAVGLSTWDCDVAPTPNIPACDIEFFEIPEYLVGSAPAISYGISRDDGTTVSGGALFQGSSHFTEDLSGQPSGNQLRMRMKLYWPARLYGWGLSF